MSGRTPSSSPWLREAIGRVSRSASGELYLTDLVALAADEGCPASVVVADDAADAIGINDRVALADAERRMQRRIAEEHMRNGVTIVDPETTRIDAGVEIGQDARIEPWTILAGSTVIAQDAVIGPHAHVRDSAHRPADDGLGQRAGGVDRRRGRRDRSVRAPSAGRPGRSALPDRELRRDQEQPDRGRDAAAPLQLPRRRRGRREREHRRRIGHRQLRRAREASDRDRRPRQPRESIR